MAYAMSGSAPTPLALQVSMMLRMTADRWAAAREPENSQLRRPTAISQTFSAKQSNRWSAA